MDPFFVFLPCNVRSLKDNPENTISNYVTQLRRRIILPPEEKWEVAMVKFSCTRSWFTLNEDAHISIHEPDGRKCDTGNAFVPKGYYKTSEELIKKVKDVLFQHEEVYKQKYPDPLAFPQFYYDTDDRSIQNVSAQQQEETYGARYADFGPELSYILGINQKFEYDDFTFLTAKAKGKFLGEFFYKSQVDLNNSYHSLYVYTDIIRPSLIGDTLAPILNIVQVPSSSTLGDQLVFDSKNIYYPLLFHEFEKIEIDIKNENGENVPFNFGRTIVTLHFRPRK